MKLKESTGKCGDYCVFKKRFACWAFGRVGPYGPYSIVTGYLNKWGAEQALKKFLEEDKIFYYKP